MALIELYLSSVDGSDSDDGSDWALAKATSVGILAICTSGNTYMVYVDSAHAESSLVQLNLTAPSTLITDKVNFYSVDRTGNPEPPTTILKGAEIAQNTAASAMQLTGQMRFEGLIIDQTANGDIDICDGSTGFQEQEFVNCTIKLSASKDVNIGNSLADSSYALFKDCVWDFGSATGELDIRAGKVDIIGGSLSGTVPNDFIGVWAKSIRLDVEGVDFSTLTGNLYDAPTDDAGQLHFKGCLLNASTGTPAITTAGMAILTSCHTGNNSFQGKQITNTGTVEVDTVVTLTSTYDGTNKYSIKVTGSTNPRPNRFLLAEFDEIDFTTDKDFTVNLIRDGSATDYTNAEFYLEIEHPDVTNAAHRKIVTTAAASLATPVDLTNNTEAWTGAGGTNSKMEVTGTVGSAAASTGKVRVFGVFNGGVADTANIDAAVGVA